MNEHEIAEYYKAVFEDWSTARTGVAVATEDHGWDVDDPAAELVADREFLIGREPAY